MGFTEEFKNDVEKIERRRHSRGVTDSEMDELRREAEASKLRGADYILRELDNPARRWNQLHKQ